ncbi:MAG: lysophospholipid acyltransferase family protein [Thiofilum sp.]|uniref:lysophospholipid acyltransferase family protein n=1 Tax=Thiofilum sp. TaxID=2212733 RepID=UPI0025EBBFA3|nr:lysophospholipid acyltransferase family protein [Thiofilum sp.]MBK8452689.1 1-acyl-sn-glycerol-3-phosphate acyltransferase [Thiofilum sp.]
MTTVGLTLRSTVFWIGFALSILVYSLLSPIQFLLPEKINRKIVRSWGVLNLWWLKVTCNLTYQIQGLENLPKQAVVIMANHQSTFETLILPQLFGRVTWVLKRELLFIPFFGWGLIHTKPIAINRKDGRSSVAQIKQVGKEKLAEGISIAIFPEGTRIGATEHVPYKAGGGILATYAEVPVVPIAHNAGFFWPRHSFIKYPGVVTVSIGPLIETQGLSATEVTKKTQDWIEAERQRLPRSR